MAARNRAVVPALPTNSSTGSAVGIWRHIRHETQLLKALHHHLRVLAPQSALQRCFTLSKRGQDERAVGDALGTGHSDLGPNGLVQRHNLNHLRQRHSAEHNAIGTQVEAAKPFTDYYRVRDNNR